MIDPSLFDPTSLGLVVGGTIIATLMRAGWHDFRITLGQLGALAHRPFDLHRAKADLARAVYGMQNDGVIRGDLPDLTDCEFADATRALIRTRSLEALVGEHERHRALRLKARNRAVQTLEASGELAPILGMAGTLLALAALPASGFDEPAVVMQTVSKAVVTTLYGLVISTFLFFPLARAVDRRFERDSRRRDELTDWLVDELRVACPNPATQFRSLV